MLRPVEESGTPPHTEAEAREQRRRERAARRVGAVSGAGAQAPVPERSRSPRWRQIARRRALALVILVVLIVLILWAAGAFGGGKAAKPHASGPLRVGSAATSAVLVSKDGDGIKVGTFLGTASRRFYGRGPAPRHLNVVWKTHFGGGWTTGAFVKDAPMYWSGTGWTAMPNIVRDGGRLYVLIGGYDHKLHKIDATNGHVVWAYDFGDAIKSSPSVIANPHPTGQDDHYLVLAGSRRGDPTKLGDPKIAPYRAVAFGSGKEVWRLPTPRTASYSQDCDGSGFYLDGRQYIGAEDGWFYALDPFTALPWQVGGESLKRPRVVAQRLLLGGPDALSRDPVKHPEGYNLTIEASPALLGDTIFIASGAGHVYGLRRSDLAVVFDYRTGSDLDGTTVPTRAGKLLVPVEKQYIKGHGGVLLLDPTKPASRSVVWFFPTGNRHVADWDGGVVGSAAVNDEYGGAAKYPPLAVFIGIDGYLHVVSQDALATGTVKGPNLEPDLPTPVELFRTWVNGGISTPIIVGNALVTATYDGRVHLFRIHYKPAQQGQTGALRSRDGKWWTVRITQTAQFTGSSSFESTPVLWEGHIYVGCRDGWFYCLGDG
jgi:outer membrane protein assembly factor BamB